MGKDAFQNLVSIELNGKKLTAGSKGTYALGVKSGRRTPVKVRTPKIVHTNEPRSAGDSVYVRNGTISRTKSTPHATARTKAA